MKWIKASEKCPAYSVPAKYNDGKGYKLIGEFSPVEDGYSFASSGVILTITKKQLHFVEWLDESAPVDDVVESIKKILDDNYGCLSVKKNPIDYVVSLIVNCIQSRQPEVDALKEEVKRLTDAAFLINEQVRYYTDENAQLKKRVEELEGIANGIEEGADFWKSEYDACRAILSLLVQLKVEKDTLGKTDFYIQNQPLAWMEAKEFLKKYQHH